MGDREEKQFDAGCDLILQMCRDLIKSMQTFLIRIDHEPLTFRDYHNMFTALQGLYMNLIKLCKQNEHLFTQRLVFPVKLIPIEDEESAQSLRTATEGRVNVFNHDNCPLLLRTTFDPEIEAKLNSFAAKVSNITPDQAQKQITSANKVVQNIVDVIRTHREEAERDSSRNNFPATTNQSDTVALGAAIFLGKGLKPETIQKQQPQIQTPPRPQIPKGPTLKTNIKTNFR